MTRSTGTQTRTFVYNSSQQLASATNPETGTVTYTYNPDGRLATRTDAKNQKLVYVYDTNKRVTQIQRYPTASGPEDTYQRTTLGTAAAISSRGRAGSQPLSPPSINSVRHCFS